MGPAQILKERSSKHAIFGFEQFVQAQGEREGSRPVKRPTTSVPLSHGLPRVAAACLTWKNLTPGGDRPCEISMRPGVVVETKKRPVYARLNDANMT